MRLISLVPSVTETLSEWGRTPVACTRFCERPDLEHVGGTKNPDLDRIVDLQPDLVVMDAEENRREDHDALVTRGVPVLALHVRALADVNPSLATLSQRVRATWRPVVLDAGSSARRRAFVPIWRRPWMALGEPTYGASLLAHLGVATVTNAEAYPTITLEDMCDLGPDLVVAPSEPYPFGPRHLAELERVAPTILVDGRDLFWWGVRTPDALRRLELALRE